MKIIYLQFITLYLLTSCCDSSTNEVRSSQPESKITIDFQSGFKGGEGEYLYISVDNSIELWGFLDSDLAIGKAGYLTFYSNKEKHVLDVYVYKSLDTLIAKKKIEVHTKNGHFIGLSISREKSIFVEQQKESFFYD